jgi:hypothetical protein
MPKAAGELCAVDLYGPLPTGRPLHFDLLGCVYKVCQIVYFEGSYCQDVPTEMISTKTVSESMKWVTQSHAHVKITRTCLMRERKKTAL